MDLLRSTRGKEPAVEKSALISADQQFFQRLISRVWARFLDSDLSSDRAQKVLSNPQYWQEALERAGYRLEPAEFQILLQADNRRSWDRLLRLVHYRVAPWQEEHQELNQLREFSILLDKLRGAQNFEIRTAAQKLIDPFEPVRAHLFQKDRLYRKLVFQSRFIVSRDGVDVVGFNLDQLPGNYCFGGGSFQKFLSEVEQLEGCSFSECDSVQVVRENESDPYSLNQHQKIILEGLQELAFYLQENDALWWAGCALFVWQVQEGMIHLVPFLDFGDGIAFPPEAELFLRAKKVHSYEDLDIYTDFDVRGLSVRGDNESLIVYQLDYEDDESGQEIDLGQGWVIRGHKVEYSTKSKIL